VRRHHWAAILAGGDGSRLRALTRGMAGDDRPKQFCALVGADALLTATRRRTALTVPPYRTLVVVNRAHEIFYTPLLADLRVQAVTAQPENRGTAPAILYALFILASRGAAQDSVMFFPSDHFVSDDITFMRHMEEALGATVLRPDLVTLLGVAPDRAEPGYGWIEPGELVAGSDGEVRNVRSFWEKPATADAERIRQKGWFWNTFVMVGRVSTFLALARLTAPDLYRSFAEVTPALGTVGEWPALERLYCGLPSMDFSRHVLTARPDRLAVLPVRDVHWSDLGDPDRVLATRRWTEATSDVSPATEPISKLLPA
jgi:mannose-1-phosphate guanylyltransferase